MTTQTTYATLLRTWTTEQVADLLRARPDLATPPPQSIDELVRRSLSVPSLFTAVRDLPTQSHLVLEALVLLNGPPVEALAALSDPAPTPEQVERALADLRARLLLGPDTLTVERDVARDLHCLCQLGTSLAELLPTFTAYTLREVTSGLGLPEARTKAAAVHQLLEAYGTPEKCAQVVARLPQQLVQRLRALDATGPVAKVPGLDPSRERWPDDPVLLQLLDLALVVLRGGAYVEVPQEVSIGVRHPHPLRLAVPEPAPGPAVDPTAVAASGAAAAYDALGLLDAIADDLDRAPLPLVSSGGVGVRELRRLGPPADVATLLELALELALVALMSKDLRLARRWDTWRGQPDAERWSDLARAWTRLAVLPVARGGGRAVPALQSYPSYEAGEVRRRLLAALRTWPGAQMTAGHYAQRWYTEPLQVWATGQVQVEDVLDDLLAEAALLGVAVDGIPTPLVALTPDALTGLTQVGEQRVRAQGDGTLVCTGVPALQLRRDLDALATVESRGAATVWRLTEASLARAYAAGWTAERARTALQHWAGDLPQALGYLIGDAERRAGRLRTGAAASYVVAQDEAALADAVQALRSLKLTTIAPTVAVSSATPEALAAALAKAGLAAGGVRSAARPKGKRGAGREPAPLPVEPDVEAVARSLR